MVFHDILKHHADFVCEQFFQKVSTGYQNLGIHGTFQISTEVWRESVGYSIIRIFSYRLPTKETGYFGFLLGEI